MKMIGPWAAVLLAGLLWEARANSCHGSDEEAKVLPRRIGRPHAAIRTPYLMPCDTMEVRIGDTCTIHPGSMLHFGPNSSNHNVILVQGHLEVLGSDEAPVYFSGTLADGDFGLKPGEGSWGGFRIDPVGSIDMQSARIFRAVPALESKSENLRLKKVVFKNSLEFRGPNGRTVALDFKETRIDDLNFAPSTPEAAKEPSSLPVTEASPARSKSLTWTLIGGGTLLAGAGLFWYLNDDNDPSGPSDPGFEYPEKPIFPDNPAR